MTARLGRVGFSPGGASRGLPDGARESFSLTGGFTPMSLLTDSAHGLLRPEEVGDLLVEPITQQSVAMAVSTVVRPTSGLFRIPIIVEDAAAAWVNESEDITDTQPTVDELVVTPSKVAALVKVSSELAEDSSPEATEVVRQSLARAIARKIDRAYFAASTSKGPSGLLSLENVQVIDGGSTFTNTDAFTKAKIAMEKVGSRATAFVASANTVEQLEELKTFDGTDIHSNEPLLEPNADATAPTTRRILGVDLWSVADAVAIATGLVWGLDKAKSYLVLRRDVTLAVDPSFYFGSDSLAVRATARVGFAWPHEEACVKIIAGGS
ncbi:phage major capsid protein [Mycobacterium seoulense]|uniref:phage major capsid protein n=1 Tax=Mycobacterium seoulense TaxID=386911 RepID=UPI003CFB18DF